MPTPPDPPVPQTLKLGLRLLSGLSTVSILASGAILALTTVTVGPYLAMGAAIWTMRTTEPSEPHLPFPTLPWLLLFVAGIVGLGLELSGTRPRAGRLLAWAGALGALGLPMVQLYRMWAAT